MRIPTRVEIPTGVAVMVRVGVRVRVGSGMGLGWGRRGTGAAARGRSRQGVLLARGPSWLGGPKPNREPFFRVGVPNPSVPILLFRSYG